MPATVDCVDHVQISAVDRLQYFLDQLCQAVLATIDGLDEGQIDTADTFDTAREMLDRMTGRGPPQDRENRRFQCGRASSWVSWVGGEPGLRAVWRGVHAAA